MTQRRIPKLTFIGLACLLGAVQPTTAQQTVRATVDTVEYTMQQSPDFSFSGPEDKRVTERDWLEIEVTLKVEKARDASNDLPMVEELEFRYFVLFAGTNPQTNNRYMATGDITHVNVRTDVEVRSVAYIPPDAMFRFTGGKDNYRDADVEAVAVEILHKGQLVGGKATAEEASRWWRGTFPGTPGFVRAKPDTPFSPLWYDYHLDVKPRE